MIFSADAEGMTACVKGFARGEFFFDEDAKFTACKKCNWKLGEYQKTSGQGRCDTVVEGYHVGMSSKLVLIPLLFDTQLLMFNDLWV